MEESSGKEIEQNACKPGLCRGYLNPKPYTSYVCKHLEHGISSVAFRPARIYLAKFLDYSSFGI